MSQIETSLTPGSGTLTLRTRFFNWDFWEPIAKFLVLILGVGIIMIALQKNILFNWWFQRILKSRSPFFAYLFIFNTVVFIAALIFRTILWFKYRAFDSQKVEEWPEVTVLVPAYNEGDTVYKTICSIAESDYPAGKLKIISVDDGSKDDTYMYMCKAKDQYPEIVELIKFEKNQGKREGIYRSFQKTTTPFIITVDSDTLLEPDSIKELIAPLVLKSRLAAVTGRIKIWNSDANMLTKMLKANFAMAFDFTRAIQSTFSSVFCTSGAFSAYRTSVLREVIDNWRGQTFLSRQCTYGEDRSLANHILKTGYGTFYQRTATAFTKVPERLGKVLKMLTRWARSNIRESIIFTTIMFNRNRRGNYLFPFVEFFFTIVIVFIHMIMFYYFFLSGFVDGDFLLRTTAYGILFGFFYMLYYMRIEGGKDFPYIVMFSIFSSVFMVWIFTVAGMTLTTKSWSTRELQITH